MYLFAVLKKKLDFSFEFASFLNARRFIRNYLFVNKITNCRSILILFTLQKDIRRKFSFSKNLISNSSRVTKVIKNPSIEDPRAEGAVDFRGGRKA